VQLVVSAFDFSFNGQLGLVRFHHEKTSDAHQEAQEKDRHSSDEN
jgi:hypothetical protein